MAWLNSEVHFGNRSAVFYVTHHDEINLGFKLHSGDNPDDLERLVYDLIVKHRPELAGCVLFHMKYEAQLRQWEFAVCHASLQSIPLFCELPKLPLVPEKAGSPPQGIPHWLTKADMGKPIFMSRVGEPEDWDLPVGLVAIEATDLPTLTGIKDSSNPGPALGIDWVGGVESRQEPPEESSREWFQRIMREEPK